MNGQFGSFVINDLDAGTPVYGFDFKAKVRLGGGSSNPADGFALDFDPSAGPNSDPQPAEEGTKTGFSVTFDLYDNGFETPPAPSIDLRLDGAVLATHQMTIADFDTGAGFADLHATLSADGTFSLAWKGSTNFTNIPLPNFQPLSGASFVIAARTGGLNENQWFDDLSLTTFTLPILRIMQQPTPQVTLSGRTAVFSVRVKAPEAATFRWFKDGVQIPGATAPTLKLPNVTSADNGTKYKVVINGENTVTSDEVSLTVLTLHPQLDLDFNNGQLPAGTHVFGSSLVDSSGGVGNSGVLKLVLAQNYQSGAFIIDPLLAGAEVSGFTALFDVRMGGGSSLPADGFSFSFAPELPSDVTPNAEEGVGQGLSISFDIWDNGNKTPPAPSIDVRYKGQVIASTHFSVQDIVTGDEYRTVFVHLSADGKLDLAYGDLLLASGLPLPNFTFVQNGMFGFYARTGAANENIWIDNLKIETMPSGQ